MTNHGLPFDTQRVARSPVVDSRSGLRRQLISAGTSATELRQAGA